MGREHCEDLWRDFAPHADDHFLAEFPVHFHERWFEMYLTIALIRAGLDVQCPKPGPDVLLTVHGQRIWIEAVCATPGNVGNPDSVPEPRYAKLGEKPVVKDVPQNEMVLRLRNSLSVKEKKFRGYLKSGHDTEGDVLVVALNVHAVPGAWADMGDLMMRALYGVGNLVLTLNRNTGAAVGSHHEQLASIAKKSTGAPVGVQPFIDGSMPHISAVIGSRADAVNLPHRLGDDFAVLPNPTAAVAWQTGSIRLGEEWSLTQASDGWDGKRISYIM